MLYFVTGSTGFIGKNLLEKLQDEVYSYKRGEDVSLALHNFNPNVIIHLAGEIYDENSMFSSNTFLTYQLLMSSIDIPYKAFIYVGSSSEYGRKNNPMSETDYLDPTNLYEATKGCGSLLSLGIAREFKKPIMIARPFSVYGKYEPEKRFIPTIIRCLKNNQELSIYYGYHDFIYVDDFINGLIMLALNPVGGEVFNFGSGVQFSNEEVVEKIERIAKKKINKKYIKGLLRAYDTNNWICDNRKAVSMGWRITKSLSEGLYEVMEGIKNENRT